MAGVFEQFFQEGQEKRPGKVGTSNTPRMKKLLDAHRADVYKHVVIALQMINNCLPAVHVEVSDDGHQDGHAQHGCRVVADQRRQE